MLRSDIFAEQPLAVSDSLIIIEDIPTAITFVGVDVSTEFTVDESTSLINIVDNPKNGHLGVLGSPILDSSGQLVRWSPIYTPNDNFSGIDSIGFTYTNSNNSINGGQSETAYLYIIVNAVNDPPQSSNLLDQTVVEGGILNIPLSINSLDKSIGVKGFLIS